MKLKFRAWYVLAEEMIDEILMISFVRKEIIGKFSDGSTSVPLKFEDKRNGEDVILMQSTGLKDKNGREIFEGDIVKRDGIKRPEVVRFGEWIDVDSLGYKEQYIGFYFESEHEGQEWLHSVEPQFNHLYKIIGNIYKNPKLLQEVDD